MSPRPLPRGLQLPPSLRAQPPVCHRVLRGTGLLGCAWIMAHEQGPGLGTAEDFSLGKTSSQTPPVAPSTGQRRVVTIKRGLSQKKYSPSSTFTEKTQTNGAVTRQLEEPVVPQLARSQRSHFQRNAAANAPFNLELTPQAHEGKVELPEDFGTVLHRARGRPGGFLSGKLGALHTEYPSGSAAPPASRRLPGGSEKAARKLLVTERTAASQVSQGSTRVKDT
ncbi:hypothetical protein Anapl_06646 [Anas platyrhynchos]|uniref:Uncharacterized protein n=1 Tax=Anas platyrhynchos TaxID=8839 RepID=R0L6B0_ANAPL|nr:hypothetical protein Anapl_06646 [Anas platyrhynchos]